MLRCKIKVGKKLFIASLKLKSQFFTFSFRVGEGIWRRGAETPRAVKKEERIIEVREGSWSYIASSIGVAPREFLKP